MNQKGISSIVIILIIVGVLVIVGGIYWWQKSVAPTTLTKINELPTKTDELKVKSVKTIIEDMSLIGSSGKHPKLSNDGEKIIYRETGRDAGLWIVNSDGTGLKRLTNELAAGGGTYDFGWSPDDKFIHYKTQSFYPVVPTLFELKVIEVETGIIKSVFQTPTESFNIASPQWISQKEIAFVHINEPDISKTSVKVVDVNLGKVIQPSKEITLYFWYIKGSSLVSPGQRMTIASVSTNGTVREITPDGAVSVPLVFPDGKKIAYASNCASTRASSCSLNGLVIMNIDGSNPKIISSEIVEGEPVLSPGGDMFAYYKTRDDGHILLESDIYVMNVDGTGEKKLTESGNKMAMEPRWSPDGNKIAVFYYGTGEIGVIEIESK